MTGYTGGKYLSIMLTFYPRENYKPFAIFQSDDYAHNLMQYRFKREGCKEACDECACEAA